MDDLKELIDVRHEKLLDMAEGFRREMTAMFEDAQRNAVLAELKKITTRLDEFEKRLPSNNDKVLGDED